MIYKFRRQTLGGHVHVALFVAKAENMTFAKSGDLVFSAGDEFEDFKGAVAPAEYPRVIWEEKP